MIFLVNAEQAETQPPEIRSDFRLFGHSETPPNCRMDLRIPTFLHVFFWVGFWEHQINRPCFQLAVGSSSVAFLPSPHATP
jgi:hypothetical protein